MSSIRTLTLAILASAAFAPAAFAQDASGDTASGKHFSVVGGYSLYQPTRNPDVAGTLTDIDGGGTATLGATYHINDNWAVEAWGADKVDNRVNSHAGGKIGEFEAQPYSVSGQYQFGSADQTFRPYLGLGYYEANYSGEQSLAGGDHIGIETAKGPVATVGVDVNITPTWFARADARYFDGESDVKQGGAKIGEVDMNPVIVGVGIGARF